MFSYTTSIVIPLRGSLSDFSPIWAEFAAFWAEFVAFLHYLFPQLGAYLLPVLGAYASMIILILGLLVISLARGNSSKKTLAALEKIHRKGRDNG